MAGLTPLSALIVEDHADDARLLVRTLQKDGFEVRYRRVSTETEYLGELDKPYDLILADYTLPSFTAPMALRHLHERNLDIPFVVVTGSVGEEKAVECIKQGAADYLLKDRLVRLGEAIRQALNAKRLNAEKRRAEQERELLLEKAQQARAEAEAEHTRLQAVFLQAPALMAMTTGPEHVLERANNIFLQVTCKQDVIGRPARAAFPELEGQGFFELLDHVYQTGISFNGVEMLVQLDDNGVLKDCYLTFVYQAMRDADGTIDGILFHGVDVTEQVVSRQHLEQRTAEIGSLNERLRHQLNETIVLRAIDLAIASNLGDRLSLEFLLEQATRALNVDAAALLFCDDACQELKYGFSRGFRTDSMDGLSIKFGEGLAGLVASERRVHHVPDLTELPLETPGKATLDAEAFVSYYALPLLAKGRVQGVLELVHRSPLAPDDDWKALAKALSNQAAIAVDNALLLNELQISNQSLIQAYDANIEAWARALDLRDRETEGHSRRVTELTVALAREMGIGENDLVHIRRGALLHDIGKMGVPDSILLKPGSLDNHEWEVMKLHPTFARDLLSPIKFLEPALDIPYCHHEKWDGSGYPLGVAGEAIPVAARIFAIVDVYDALSSDRPYRNAWPREKVASFLKEQAGRHFDPAVVEAFLRLMADFEVLMAARP